MLSNKNQIKDFYDKQDVLFGGLYIREINETDYGKLDLIHQMTDVKSKNILELGAGGGQSAFVAAQAGHNVVAIETNSRFVKHAKKLSRQETKGSLEILQDDFYEIEVDKKFDLITYWDGFGIGTDEDQRFLLRKIHAWLKPGGVALIDIYTPWNAIEQNGVEIEFKKSKRRYGYDAENNRWLDTWWSINDQAQHFTQSLRCYTPADLRLLLHGINLVFETFNVGPCFDSKDSKYYKEAPLLEKSIWFTAKLVKKS